MLFRRRRILLHVAGDDPRRQSGSGRCSLRASSAGAVIQVSTSSGFVRITGIAFGWMGGEFSAGKVSRVSGWSGPKPSRNQSSLVCPERTSCRLLQIIIDNAPEAERKVGADVNC